MFNFFRKNSTAKCPIDSDNRLWLEEAMALLLDIFQKDRIHDKAVLTPHHSDFPIRYDGSEKTAFDTLSIVAAQMDIPYDAIRLDFFDDGVKEISTGSPLEGGRIFLNTEDDKTSAGLYFGRGHDGLFHVALERKKLWQPENMVATLAHELSHIKLLGEKRISENDEKLTDLTTVVFGLGIFNANAAFQTYTTIDSSGWRKMGYLTQMEWGYALAFLESIRKQKNPSWLHYLTPNVKKDFLMSQAFIEQNSTGKNEGGMLIRLPE